MNVVEAEQALAGRVDRERGAGHATPDVERIRDLVDLLGSPQKAYPAIHLTGTNGKTSTSRMIDSLLREFGLRTGRYTSPHLSDVRERIALDGQPVDPARFAAGYADLAPCLDFVDTRHPERVTYFEALTALGFVIFADAPVDVAVVEVGMGGRWDATNVLDAATCVVTPVGLDHPELGSTVAEVAGEKAGIISSGAQVVLARQSDPVRRVLDERCATMGARQIVEDADFAVGARQVAVGGQLLTLRGLGGIYDEIYLPMHGEHQAHNAACAIAAVEAFFGAQRSLDVETIRHGFVQVDSPGRLEVIHRSPPVILDGAHNPDGVRALAAALGEVFGGLALVGVLGVLADKDAAAMLAQLEPVLAAVVCTQPRSPRARDAESLAELAREVFGSDRVHVASELPDALDVAVTLADAVGDANVLVTGSLYTVGEARTLLVGPADRP